MARHRPIYFKEPNISETTKQRVVDFLDNHSVATSAMQALLATIVVGGVLTLAVTAPGILGGWARYSKQKNQSQKSRYKQLWRNFHRLKKENALVYKGEKNGKAVYELTEKGRHRLQKFFIETLEIAAPKRWDGVWHVILFDIPIGKRKSIRNSFREKLRELGCFQYQRSVWVHPFPCEAEIQFLKDYYRLGSCVTVWKVSEMPSGRVLYHFKDILKDSM